MSAAHTPGLCGCRLDPISDDTAEPCDLCSEATGMLNGIGWKIVYCQTHAKAPELLAFLRLALPELLAWTNSGRFIDVHDDPDEDYSKAYRAAVGLLADIDRKGGNQ